MPFSTLQGQSNAISVIRRMVARQRVPGALLFLGPPHVGKRTAALALAQALNCERLTPVGHDRPVSGDGEWPAGAGPDACGACPSCRKIEASAHPDVEVVAPESTVLKIDQIRAIGDRLGLNPLEARRRVIVVAQADRMNPQAANAFLKTLEEPPADTTIVLCAADAALLPDTIVSRCLPVRFLPLEDAVLRMLLREQQSRTPRRRKSVTEDPSGGIGADVLEFAVRFAQGSLRPDLSEQAAEWYSLRDELLASLAALIGQTGRGMEKPGLDDLAGERLTRFSAKESAGFVLEWLETWWRDVAVLAAGGAAERLINGDRREALAPWPDRLGVRYAETCHRSVLALRDALNVNVNLALGLEGLWLGFKHALHDAGPTGHARYSATP